MDTPLKAEQWETSILHLLQEIGTPQEQQRAILMLLLWLHDNDSEQVSEALTKIKNQHLGLNGKG